MRVLIVEDEQALREVIERQFAKQGYHTDTCGDGAAADALIDAGGYDCIILDRMLPGKDGTTLLREMRSRGDATPVLLLTARDSILDRVEGLDAGADDYLTKPFSFNELFARVRALGRRAGTQNAATLRIADLTLDCTAQEVTRAGQRIELSAREFALLEYLMRNAGMVLSRQQITSAVWGYDSEGYSNVVDVYVRYLRRKLDDGFEPALIHTLRGRGYVLRDETA